MGELFKKTLPSASLLQVAVSNAEVRRQALAALHSSRGKVKNKDPRVSLISMALRNGKVSFDKVIKMIDDMVKLLGEEQARDGHIVTVAFNGRPSGNSALVLLLIRIQRLG